MGEHEHEFNFEPPDWIGSATYECAIHAGISKNLQIYSHFFSVSVGFPRHTCVCLKMGFFGVSLAAGLCMYIVPAGNC